MPNWTETDSGAKILNLGHVDLASLVSDGALDTKVKDTTNEGVQHATDHGASWHEPENTVFQLLPESQRAVPESESFRFLGEAGTPIWAAPQTQDHTILWPGWSTEHIPFDVLSTDTEWKLTGKQGPGEFFLYQTGDTGADVHFNTADGIDGRDALPIHASSHVHGSWAFTVEGVYCLAFERSGVLNDGTAVSDAFTLAVAVGEVDPTKVNPASCEGSEPGEPGPEPEEVAPAVVGQPEDVSAIEGESASFEASASGDPVPSVQWESSVDGAAWEPVVDATDTTLQIAKTVVAQSGTQYRAVFTNSAGEAVSEAATLTVRAKPVDPPKPPVKEFPFKDVPTTNVHYTGINWMYQNGYVAKADQFNPTKATTRGAFATMMVRKNEPSYQPAANLVLPFTDVKKTDVHYRGIAWMYEKGYAAKADKYNATNPVTRGALASFMLRMEDKSYQVPANAKIPYTDVKKTDTHYRSIMWMAEKGYAAKGANHPKYNANGSTTRGAMSTFLYRIYQ